MRSGIIFSDWEATMQLLFQSHHFPEDCRRPVAEYYLAGPARVYWAQIRDNYGPNPSLHDLNGCLSERFVSITAFQDWTEYATRFR